MTSHAGRSDLFLARVSHNGLEISGFDATNRVVFRDHLKRGTSCDLGPNAHLQLMTAHFMIRSRADTIEREEVVVTGRFEPENRDEIIVNGQRAVYAYDPANRRELAQRHHTCYRDLAFDSLRGKFAGRNVSAIIRKS